MAPTWRSLYKVSGVAAFAAGILLLAALVDFVATSLQPGSTNGWFSLLGDNWLVTLFKLHAGVSGAQPGQLYTFNFLDIAIMALVAVMFLGIYAALMKASRFWSLIAMAQPFLGMAIFIMTGAAGRSAIMGSVLVISLVMLRSNAFDRATAYTGLLASVFLLAGDFGISFARSGAVAILAGTGYVLLIAWLFRISLTLFRRGQCGFIEGACPQ